MVKLKVMLFVVPIIAIIAIIVVIVPSCSSRGELCLFGTVKSTFNDYKNAYWQSVDNKKSKASKLDIKKCSQEAENARIVLINIFTQLCTDGHISQEYLPDAVWIQHNYIENYYFGKSTEKLTGTTEQILTKFLAYDDNDNFPSVDRLNKACARYIPKDGILYHYPEIGPDIPFYTNYYFEQCMIKNNFESIAPVTTKTYCKGIGW
ncbi:hypothetical protein GA0061081_10280 [Gilliamella bombicola]|uniref:Uncharacterized protein n=1 Tax=Gilliamella bombicola TaxID=1798182 RepID=A0A1C3ZT48_9GAMM|nr:hypothetical protein [Gilliamella bombicola]SCB85503.1 hypothetical protein GA0061081_10280 [Gilliamella bombicola]